MATAQIFTNYVTSTTQDYIMPKIIDSVLDSNVITARFLSNPKRFRGEQFKSPIRVGINNASAAQGGGFRGTDTFVTNIQDETKQLVFNPKYVYEPLNFVGTDLSTNMGEEQVVDIVKRETEYSMSNLLDNIGTMFYGSADESSKNFSGLAHIISSSGSYGGLSRSTYTVLKPGDTSGNGLDTTTTTLTLAAMRSVTNALTSGADKPTMGLTTKAIFGFYEALLQPMQRMDIGGYAQVTRDKLAPNQGALGGATGFDALMFDGIPLVRDDKCTANALYFINEKYLDFYRLDGFMERLGGWKQVSFKPDVVEGQYDINLEDGHKTAFYWSGFKEPTNQAAVNSQIVVAGDLICTNPKRQGGFTGITA